MLFISHANPDDNEKAQWLSLQLARIGFSVWSDVTKLIGGEKFWDEIETAILGPTKLFLLCVTSSCNRPGVIREIELAQKAEKTKGPNLIVPLKFDDTRFDDFPLDLGSFTNAVRFDEGWAPGLNKLLVLLTRKNIQPDNPDGPSVVRDWWAQRFPADEGVERRDDRCLSNFFPFFRGTSTIYYHHAGTALDRGLAVEPLPVLVEAYKNGFLSFEKPSAARSLLPRFKLDAGRAENILWKPALSDGVPTLGMRDSTFKHLFFSLLKRAFWKLALSRGCQHYELSQKKRCFWLQEGVLENDSQDFTAMDGKRRRRGLVGFKTLTVGKDGSKNIRKWHFALQAVPSTDFDLGLILSPHVVFSLDGQTPIESVAKQHSARRNQGSDWWNAHWRDRVLATASFMAAGSQEIALPVSSEAALFFSVQPLGFVADHCYRVVHKQAKDPIDREAPDEDEGDANE